MRDGKPDQGLYMGLGERIRRTRELRKLSQDELGKAVGLTRGSVANIEHGRQRFMVHTLVDLSRALDVPVDTLLQLDYPSGSTMTEADMLEQASIQRDGARAFVHAALSGPRKQH